MYTFYNLLTFIGTILYFPKLLFKKGPENKQTFIKERLGISSYTKTDIWVHAVSVGEVLACIPFLKKLKKEFPGEKVVLSTTTYTGQKLAKERFTEADRVMYVPVDTYFSVNRAVNALRPKLFITAETELWPAMFKALKKSGSRVIILNGRISDASYSGYKNIRYIMKKVLSHVDFFYMQTKKDAKRIIEIGADQYKVAVMGNFKFDIEINNKKNTNWQNTIDRDILLAASTHEGEEEIVFDGFELILKRTSSIKHMSENRGHKIQHQDVMLIIAPRHPERFDEVAGILDRRNLDYIRRSAIDSIREGDTLPSIILLDTIGELSSLFSIAAIAYIGGSLVPKGGHNIMEPAYWSKPTIFGPHMENFPIAKDFLDSAAALEVKDAHDIAETVLELLHDSARASNMGRNAKVIVENNTGAVNKAIELVRGYIGTS